MLGLMSQRPLLVWALIQHAAVFHRDTEIASRTVEGATYRYTYGDAERRSRQLAQALLRLGIRAGDRVGTLAGNTYRHFELYYGISGIGAVCHTINPRLFEEQILYIINHAADRLLFVETSFLPLIERLAPKLPAECRIILLADRAGGLVAGFPTLPSYEELVAAEDADFEWPEFDERTGFFPLLHLGDHRQPEGRALQPPLDRACMHMESRSPTGSRFRRSTWYALWYQCFTLMPGQSPTQRRCKARSSYCPAHGWTGRASMSCSRRSG